MAHTFRIFKQAFLLVTTLSSSQLVWATESCDQAEKITFVVNDIFDLTEQDTLFFHRWANLLHIISKKSALQNEIAFFIDKCEISDDDLLELERYLRSRKYLRDAQVTRDEQDNIKVETWDNWSLMPTADFGRKGGVNKYSVGIQDRNLLGLGIDAEFEYFSDEQRTGYKLDTQIPLFMKNNMNANLRFSSNDDGQSQAVFLNKEFAGFGTAYAFNVGFDNFQQTDTLFQNGLDSARFQHQKNSYLAHGQWLVQNNASETLRMGMGYANEKHDFTTLPNTSPDLQAYMPFNRQFTYPFISLEYLTKDYRKLTNINLINHIEDFNLGWHISGHLGSDVSNRDNAASAIWRSQLSKGLDVSSDAFIYMTAQFDGEWYNTENQADRMRLALSTEYFHKLNDDWGAYVKNLVTLSKNQFLDAPIVLGGENGVRGFPLQYQHGQHNAALSLEARYYPHINIYKLIEVGAAAFIDVGKSFGSSELRNFDNSTLASFGLGARFYSTHSSDAQVIHVDIIKPVSNDKNVNGVEFRITAKHAF
ncbi:ShlB/FhaC/HecB family protein [Aliiglaciecola lipolytica]|uniref:Haemolysin activator HlyB C-terminal domain-containing protein n=1 Tax=Aliiglaciecola lipolytica E3 TaxID=1127673 RepID=K6Z099_9ALTE|nr:hypothetical protein [Aliiglaciecola lipolytica]GAC16875.1 hypothetical protein GLIP_4264 [Aliiglaciecola lipolytica E3]